MPSTLNKTTPILNGAFIRHSLTIIFTPTFFNLQNHTFMKKIIFVFALLFIATTKIYAQPYLTVTNNTGCNIWYDFYSADACAAPVVGTGASVIGGFTTNWYDATAIYGGTLSATHAWKYGRVGDDNSVCNATAPGGGCTRNFWLTISDGACVPGVTSGCYNADFSNPGCNTCGNTTINVTTTYYLNGDLDVTFN